MSGKNSNEKNDNGSESLQLPDDILGMIISRLGFADHVRLSLVCKSWRKLIQDIRPADTLPWLMFCRWWQLASASGQVESICKLYSPLDRKTYTVEDGIKGEVERNKFVKAQSRFSRYGWVFFTKDVVEAEKERILSFVYCPFTNEVIDLPELITVMGHQNIAAAFSSSPTSVDCLFFCFYYTKDRSGACVNICRRGDQAWKTLEVNVEFEANSWISKIIFFKGSFYCLFGKGLVAEFNVSELMWSFLANDVLVGNDCPSGHKHYADLFEFNGHLVKVTRNIDKRNCNILRFDFSRNLYVREESLWNVAIFRSYLESSFLVPAVGENSELADTVIYPRGKPDKFFQACPEISYTYKTIWIEPHKWRSIG